MDVEKILRAQKTYKQRRRIRDPEFVKQEREWRKKWNKNAKALAQSYKDFAIANIDQYVAWVETQTTTGDQTNENI